MSSDCAQHPIGEVHVLVLNVYPMQEDNARPAVRAISAALELIDGTILAQKNRALVKIITQGKIAPSNVTVR